MIDMIPVLLLYCFIVCNCCFPGTPTACIFFITELVLIITDVTVK